jgi:hypothetical protein
MAHFAIRTHLIRTCAGFVVTMGALMIAAASMAAPARADVTAYLVNVTVRPGYNFANADAAIAYGQGICDKIASGRSYAQIMGDVKSD